ncbi:Allantoicase [Mortierella alpina]|uniref:Allantoicase n=1 Tax=Mortierella alpina TaxID=64518 RepID=A0A9P6JDR0_MORAP|nr:Allantoicase [Mortierella alpina]
MANKAPANHPIAADKIDETFKDYIDLAVSTRGGKVLTLTDEWFAEAKNLLAPTAPISCPGRFVPTGAWYDGWETRRHNPHFDWCVIELGYAGKIAGFEVALEPSTRHGFQLEKPTEEEFTHIRFCMYPDGGVARLRVFGTVHKVFPENKHEIYDLASAAAGSTIVGFSDAHYGHPSNLLLPGRGHDMSDGWETKRSRTPGHVDYADIKLGQPGHVTNIEIDTAHYKGNPPKAVTVAGFEIGSDVPILLLDQMPLTPHRQHFFEVKADLTEKRIATIKVIMIPDGGIKRVRIWGASQLPAVQPENSLMGVRQELPDEHTWHVKKH